MTAVRLSLRMIWPGRLGGVAQRDLRIFELVSDADQRGLVGAQQRLPEGIER